MGSRDGGGPVRLPGPAVACVNPLFTSSRSCLGACLRAPGDELTALIKGTLGLRWDACVFSYPRVKAGDAESWKRGAGCLCQCLIQMINGKLPEASRPAPWTCVSGHENPHVSTSWAG